MLAAVAGGAAGVAVRDGVAGIHERLHLVEGVDAVRRVRAAVDHEDDGMRPIAVGHGQPPVHRVAVASVDRQFAHGRESGVAQIRPEVGERCGPRRPRSTHELAEGVGPRQRRDDAPARGILTAHLDVPADAPRSTRRRAVTRSRCTRPARAPLHEEVVADRRDVASHLAEVDGIRIGEPARAALLEQPQRDAGSDEVDALRRRRPTASSGDRAVVGDRDIRDREVRPSRPSTSRSPEPSTRTATRRERRSRRDASISSTTVSTSAAVGA